MSIKTLFYFMFLFFGNFQEKGESVLNDEDNKNIITSELTNIIRLKTTTIHNKLYCDHHAETYYVFAKKKIRVIVNSDIEINEITCYITNLTSHVFSHGNVLKNGNEEYEVEANISTPLFGWKWTCMLYMNSHYKPVFCKFTVNEIAEEYFRLEVDGVRLKINVDIPTSVEYYLNATYKYVREKTVKILCEPASALLTTGYRISVKNSPISSTCVPTVLDVTCTLDLQRRHSGQYIDFIFTQLSTGEQLVLRLILIHEKQHSGFPWAIVEIVGVTFGAIVLILITAIVAYKIMKKQILNKKRCPDLTYEPLPDHGTSNATPFPREVEEYMQARDYVEIPSSATPADTPLYSTVVPKRDRQNNDNKPQESVPNSSNVYTNDASSCQYDYPTIGSVGLTKIQNREYTNDLKDKDNTYKRLKEDTDYVEPCYTEISNSYVNT
ncbi:uncharacterized protein LOC114244170 [Bombyx mandarina]|uniref:Uncharacterized protein LOC114244170 n=1 Tax=Bombyx mandarina TaxID=7092 RepID=A0A6J2JU10_BOMMA|nr:uncharacterized protein LOC114244170 [Bombyx mandarina]